MNECRYPDKRHFLTRSDAVAGANRLAQRHGENYTPLHPYKCPGGEHWHLSSSRQGRAQCPGCRQTNVPAWFDQAKQTWVIYAHGECLTQAVGR